MSDHVRLRVWEEADVTYFKVTPKNSTGRSERNLRSPSLRCLFPEPRCEAGICEGLNVNGNSYTTVHGRSSGGAKHGLKCKVLFAVV
jgi:hypothetical protein